jgi:hypothetical protein
LRTSAARGVAACGPISFVVASSGSLCLCVSQASLLSLSHATLSNPHPSSGAHVPRGVDPCPPHLRCPPRHPSASASSSQTTPFHIGLGIAALAPCPARRPLLDPFGQQEGRCTQRPTSSLPISWISCPFSWIWRLHFYFSFHEWISFCGSGCCSFIFVFMNGSLILAI